MEPRFPLVEYRSRRSSAVSLVAIGAFFCLALLLWPLWPLTIFFGPMFLSLTVIHLRELWRSGRRIVLDEVGFTDRTLGVGRIPWQEIESVTVWNPLYPQFFLHPKDPAKWRKRQSWLSWLAFSPNRWMGYSSFLINLSGTDAERDSVVDEITQRVEVTRLMGPVDRPLLAGKKVGDSGGGEEEGLPGEEDD